MATASAMTVPGQVLDPNIASRRALTLEMMKSGRDSSPIIHPYQGLARVMSALTGAYMENQGRQEEAGRRIGMQNTVEQGMRAAQGGWTNPDTGNEAPGPLPAQVLSGERPLIAPGATIKQGPGGYEALVGVLRQNEDTAPLALQLGLQKITQEQQLARELQKMREQFVLRKEFEPGIAADTEAAKTPGALARRQGELDQDLIYKPRIAGAEAAAVTPEMNRRAGYAANATAQAGLAVAGPKAEAEARGRVAGEAGSKLPEKATALRKEFEGLQPVKNYREVVPAVQRMANAADTAAGDLNIVFGLMKTLDPASVVRESEQKIAYAAGSPAERLQGVWNYVLGGGRLTASQRSDMVAEARNALRSHQDSYEQVAGTFSRLAEQGGISPADVVLRTSVVEPEPKRAPPGMPKITRPPPAGVLRFNPETGKIE